MLMKELPPIVASQILTVATVGDLPTGLAEGAIRYVEDVDLLYTYNGSGWVATGGLISAVGDTNSIDLTESSGTLTADLRLSTDGPSANFLKATTTIKAGGNPGLHVEIPHAETTTTGVITSTDWNTFNNKMPNEFTTRGDVLIRGPAAPARLAIGGANTVFKSDGTDPAWGSIVDANVDASAAITLSKLAALTISRALVSDGSGVVSVSAVTSTELGYVSGVTSAIQTQLNAKEPTLTKGNLTETTSSVLTIVGGTAAVIGSGLTIEVDQADVANDGYLSSTDWGTFNSKSDYSNPLTTRGDVLIRDASITTRLAIGGANTVLTSDGTDTAWAQVDHVNLANKGTNTHAQIDTHLGSTSNPHSVTKDQVLSGDLIDNDDVDASAAIAWSKLAVGGTTNRILQTNSSTGVIEEVSDTPASDEFLKYNGSSYEWAAVASADNIPPIGSIIAWVGGYFTNGSNGSYTRVLGSSNDVTGVNGYLSANWRVCDGATLNDSDSPIFDGAGRYLPNLTDDRFLMGDTTITGQAGSNTMAHTHSVTSNVSVGNHSTLSLNNHSNLSLNSESSHTHSSGSICALVGANTDTGGLASKLMFKRNTANFTPTTYVNLTGGGGHDTTTEGGKFKTRTDGNTGTGSAHTHSFSTNISTHHFSQNITAHNVTNNSVTSGATSNTENRPQYLTCFYIMRVK